MQYILLFNEPPSERAKGHQPESAQAYWGGWSAVTGFPCCFSFWSFNYISSRGLLGWLIEFNGSNWTTANYVTGSTFFRFSGALRGDLYF